MSKYSHLFIVAATPEHVITRDDGDIPNCTKAYDVFVTDKDGYLTIKNPAPKYRGTAYET